MQNQGLKYKRFTDPSGCEWEIMTLFPKRFRASKVSFPGYGKKQLFDYSILASWKEHTLPTVLKKGDVLIHHGEPVLVTGFHGGRALLVGRWGFEEGHLHENGIYALNGHLLFEGFRSPFPGEEVPSSQELQEKWHDLLQSKLVQQ
jgi:hypothetical protein